MKPAVKEVRTRSNASLKDCVAALDESGGDVEKALRILEEKGIINAAKRQRLATEGRVEAYAHGSDSKLTVIVEVNCETDFAARSEPFKTFCEVVALQIAAMNPKFIGRDNIEPEQVAYHRSVFQGQLQAEGKPKPPQVVQKIIDGKMEKWFSEVCLLEQKAIAWPDDPEATIEKLRALLSSKIGETVVIRRFSRWEVGEGIEKVEVEDYAAEVAKLAGQP
jgi:elongation factor Ts